MTKKEILLKQINAENVPLTDYISTDGYVWKMVENAMEEYHQAKLKLLGIDGVVSGLSLEDITKVVNAFTDINISIEVVKEEIELNYTQHN